MMKPHSIATALIGCVAMLLGLTPAARAADRPVDVFIGDSSAVQGAYSDGTTAAQRWTRLFSDADDADEVNVAVAGTGFVVGGANTFSKQTDKAINATRGRTVRRVFVVGIGNDMSAQSAGRITSDQISGALASTMPKIAAAWPQAQKLYIPEASPMTANMKAAYQRMEPYMPDIYSGVKLVGFTSLERWDTLVDGNGTSRDGTHLNRKGNNLMAHAMQQWVNTLDGPKNTGSIPAWGDGGTSTQNRHTVSFDMAGGPAKDPVKVADGQSLPTPAAPARPGWTFQGWLLDGQPYDFTQPITRDITLTATWAKDPDKPATGTEADVFFGDSSVAGMTVANRWSTLLAAMDHAVPIDESANGTGFNEELYGISYARQQEQALGHLKQRGIPATSVKRVIISTSGEDLGLIAKDPANADKYITYIKNTLQSIRAAYPNARFYLTGVGVRNPTTEKAIEQERPYFQTMLDIAATLGWNTKGAWPFLAGDDPDYALTFHDHVHMNKDGHKQAAPRVADWIDTFGAPKVGEPIPTDGTHTVVFDTGLTGTAGAIPPQSVKDGRPASKPADPKRDGWTFQGWLLDGKPYGFDTPVTGNIMLTADWRKAGAGIGLDARQQVDPTAGKDGAYTLTLSATSPYWPATGSLAIVDTLTAWADFAAGDDTPVTVSEDGKPMDAGRYLAKVSAKDHNVTVSFTGGLKDGATYLVSLPIIISSSGRHQATQGGLTDTGEPGTGPESAGRKGLYATSGGAAIWNDGANLVNKPFPKPVIQPTHADTDPGSTPDPKPTGKPVDVFIGDSTTVTIAGNGVTDANRWSRLVADADKASEVNVAIGGTGFIQTDDKTDYKAQADTALTRVKAMGANAMDVRRVYLVGGGNDLLTGADATTMLDAMGDTADKVKSLFPAAQYDYIPEVLPHTTANEQRVAAFKPTLDQAVPLLQSKGFHVAADWWDWLPDADANGYAAKDEPKPTPVMHTVTFDSAGGPSIPAQRLNVGEKASEPPTPKRDGYEFNGWLLDGKPYDFGTPVTENLTLTASWTEKTEPKPTPATHTVSFDTNGGPKVESQTVEDGKPVAKPADPTREGYTFKEWALDGKAYDFTTPVTHDLTLTAVWTPVAHGVKPVVHTVAFDTGTNRFARTVADGGHVTRPADPTRDGYRFDGWMLCDRPYDFTTPVIADITLAARWTPVHEPALSSTGADLIPLVLLVVAMLTTGITILYLAHRNKH